MQKFLRHLLVLALASLVAGPALCAENPVIAKVGIGHYRGKWLEIGRTPMFLTDGCVAGYSIYSKGNTPNEVVVEDGCRMGNPKGRLKTIHGTGEITDFGTAKAKMRVRYPLFITFNYWVRYEAPDRSWFISTTPDMSDLWIYARSVPTKSKLRRMTRKAGELGYDVRKLEFPAQ